MNFINKISFLIIAVFFTSCSRVSVRDVLLDVESYMSERPDSAYAVLDSIDRSLLTTKGLKAHHALLHAMALDKNFIDVDDDSLARTALEYYKSHGDKKYHARSLYYLAVADYYQGRHDRAIIKLTEAEKIAECHDSVYWGMIKIMQADTYRTTYNEVEQFNCLQVAHRIFHEMSLPYYIAVTDLQLAQLYADRFEYEKAEQLLNRLLETDEPADIVKVNSLLCLAFVKVMQSEANASESVRIFETVLSEYGEENMTVQSLWAYAYALSIVGDRVRSDELVRKLGNEDFSEQAPYWQYRIAKVINDIPAALKYLEESNYRDNDVIATVLNQSLSLVQRDYYETRSELAEYKARSSRWVILAVIAGSLFFIIILLFTITRYVHRLKEEKAANFQYAEELIRQMKMSQEDDSRSLKKKYMELYKSQFETLRILCDEYFRNQNTTDAERKIYRKVALLVDEIRKDSTRYMQFECMVDEGLDNIMMSLRHEMPDLRELDYIIFCYFAVGFDATVISYLVDKSINTIYIRKSRIRSAVEEANPPHRDSFLEILADSRLSAV